MSSPSSLPRVRSFEGRILTILDALLLRVPAQRVIPFLRGEETRPDGFSREALRLIQQRLRRGLLRILARGGWSRQSFVQDDRRVTGRLWERHAPSSLRLEFSPFVLELLLDLAFAPEPSLSRHTAQSPQPRTVGDRVLCLIGWEFVRETPLAVEFRQRGPWSTDGLLRLTWPEDFDREATIAGDFRPWFDRGNQWLLEAWQSRLIERWGTRTAPHVNHTVVGYAKEPGRPQQILNAFLQAANAAGRRDLTLWILRAAGTWLRRTSEPPPWSDVLATISAWNSEARRTGYLDEGYAASQLWKNEWERWDGDEIFRRANIAADSAR